MNQFNQAFFFRPNGLASLSNNQRGMALMTMIFIMVIMGSALTFMAKLSQQQTSTNNMALIGARAKWAAMAGLNWAAYKISQAAVCPTPPSPFKLSEKDLNNFTLTVTCTKTNYAEGAGSVDIFLVISRAEYGALGQPDYAFRELEVVMEQKAP